MYLHVEKIVENLSITYFLQFVTERILQMCILCTVHRSVTCFNIGLKLEQVSLFCWANLGLGYIYFKYS